METDSDSLAKYLHERDIERRQRLAAIAALTEDEKSELLAETTDRMFKTLKDEYPGVGILDLEALFANTDFDFSDVQEFLKNIASNSDKQKFLLEIKAKFDRRIKKGFFRTTDINPDVFRFGEYCEIEIQKINTLIECERESKKQTREGNQFKRELATLILDYLFRYAEATDTQLRKQEAIESLTGYATKQIGNDYRYFKAESKKGTELGETEKDYYQLMQDARSFFTRLRLTEIATMIDADLQATNKK